MQGFVSLGGLRKREKWTPKKRIFTVLYSQHPGTRGAGDILSFRSARNFWCRTTVYLSDAPRAHRYSDHESNAVVTDRAVQTVVAAGIWHALTHDERVRAYCAFVFTTFRQTIARLPFLA